jgi:AhpD family alkylhydroperoxidase
VRLQQRDKELAAICASIGANCRPCVEHHVPAGRGAGLSEAELAEAVATAKSIRDEAVELFSARVDELLGRGGGPAEPVSCGETSRDHELVALGASIGANSHPLLDLHIGTALDIGLTAAEVEAALKMAEYVQQRAADMTTERAGHILEQRAAASATAAGTSGKQLDEGDRDGTQMD